MITQTFGNIEYAFQRRRYNGKQTFTWLLWRVTGSVEWNTFGDPYPKVRLSKADLGSALTQIAQQIEGKAQCVTKC